MSAFLAEVPLVPLFPAAVKAAGSSVQLYRLYGDLYYQSDLLGMTIVIPTGFTTDFASIPRPVWNILDPEDPIILYPSIVHDYLYSILGKLPGRTITREQADAVLREAMEWAGANLIERNMVYEAVEVGGADHWHA